MAGWTDTFIAFIERNHVWFAVAENLAFLSILIPSTAVLVAIGALVATGAVPFWPLFIGAGIGAIVGSTVSYWLGWRYGGSVLALWPLKNHPDMVEKGRETFARYGAAAIMIGHFTTIFRPVAFLMAGISRMPVLTFLAWNTIGSLAWAYLIPKLGQFGGDILGWLWSVL
jgi:membrane protein DedA with SNARE-associated domain